MKRSTMRPMQHSSKLQNVRYELRGPLLQAAKQMEAEGTGFSR